jgi:hypothetical protein
VEEVFKMPTDLDKLITQAQKVGRHRTKKEAVTAALKEYIARKKQEEITPSFGIFDFDPKYDYKKARNV